MTSVKSSELKETTVPADFQTAVAATGFGKFNIFLILVCIPAAWTTQFESSLVSFIIPAAGCDLDLSPSQKALLNSITVIGMLASGFLWGVLLDTLGRRKILIIAFIGECLIIFGKTLSQEYYALSVLKFFGGTLTGGIYVAVNTYLLEFHSTHYRGRIQMLFGMIYCAANILIPLLSSAILPLTFHVQFYFLHFYSWNLLIFISSSASIISAICFWFLPESPKFLMSIGNNEEALEIFRKIYRFNHGKSAQMYPVDSLIQEIDAKTEAAANKKSWIEYIKAGVQQMAPLFGRTYGPKLLYVSLVQGSFQMSLNALRFYIPQIFQANHEFEVANNGTTPSMCQILDLLRAPKPDEEYTCTVNLENNFKVYLNSVIIAAVALISYGMVGTLINIFGKKRLLIFLGISAGIAGSCMYLSSNIMTTLSLSSIYLAACGICFDIFITVVVVVFPTTLRAMAFSLCLFIGRLWTVVGNMVFPLLVETGCVAPFLSLGGTVIVAVILVFFSPNTDKVDMK